MPFKIFKLVIQEFLHSRNRAKCYRTVIQYKVPYQTALVCLRTDLIKINPNQIRELLCPEINKKKPTKPVSNVITANRRNYVCGSRKSNPNLFISYKSVRLDMTTNGFFLEHFKCLECTSLLVIDPHPELD